VTVNATLTTEDGTPIGVPGAITVRANPPGYTFYIVGGAIVALILVFGIVRTLRRSRPSEPPPVAPHPVVDEGGDPGPDIAPEGDGEIVVSGAAGTRVPEGTAVATASPAAGPDAAPRRMTDDRT
jgi:hypothetical protein